MSKEYMRLRDGATVQALKFTGDNRTETREFFGKLIVIRQGKFFTGTDYVKAGEWMVKDSMGNFTHMDEDKFIVEYAEDDL